MINNKKGQLATFVPFLLIGIVIAFIFYVVAIPVAHINDELLDAFQENIDISNSTDETIDKVQSRTTNWFDQVVFFTIISIIVGTLIFAILTDYHPIVLGALVLVMVIMVIIAGLFADVGERVASNDVLSAKASEFTFSNALMGTQLPVIITILGVIAVIILLSKRGRAVSPV